MRVKDEEKKMIYSMSDEKRSAVNKKKSRVKGKTEVAVRMLNEGLSPEDIARYTGLTLDEIKKIRTQKKANWIH